ncbi:hypothetical protein D047_0462B, partial [Vibrio parahaemolyticus VPTS-2010_2]
LQVLAYQSGRRSLTAAKPMSHRA